MRTNGLGSDMTKRQGIASIDGNYIKTEDAKISVFDLGFERSDVVYDVISTWKGLFFRLDDHLDRFLRSAEGFRLSCPYDREEIKQILAECTSRAALGEADEAFLSSTAGGIMPVTRVGGKPLGDGDPGPAQDGAAGSLLGEARGRMARHVDRGSVEAGAYRARSRASHSLRRVKEPPGRPGSFNRAWFPSTATSQGWIMKSAVYHFYSGAARGRILFKRRCRRARV